MNLTTEQKQTFFDQGFVKLPNAVPEQLVHKALHAINASLGSEGMDPARLVTFRTQSYCPEVQRTAAITDLMTASPLWSLAESAIGANTIQPVQSGQIALRFPTAGLDKVGGPHLDGMYSPDNGVQKGRIQNFTALVGIFLSDIPQPFMGNFTVWPGTHHLYEQYFREHTPQSLLQGLPAIQLPEPQQITGKAGDAVLVHYQLAHAIAANTSPFIRYGIFFRLSHINHDEIHWECMTDIWREWAGMRDITSAARRA
ncbi:hypothetical protein KDA_27110 [Dictyobacter alpinus]|uniref:Phytanoyl-CoA dioxygenase n=1 Tax=Dictyobacter alpinus TaxID=2014873 RepID=A0A402B7C4_9CHLR|nr:phytanoyl-CoA dioxygenase family protein [Dictyobacter alpinus]GCE27227.1 hypothetical protein KDA_27110 [Dictyobacter alpinus]